MGSRFPLQPKTLSLHLDPGVTSLKSQEVSRDKSGSAFRRALEHSLLPLWKRPHQGQGQMVPLMVPSTQAGPPGSGGGVFLDIWISSRMMDCKCRWPLVSEGHESSNPLSLLAGGLSLWMSSGSWEPSSPPPPYFLLGRHTVPTSLLNSSPLAFWESLLWQPHSVPNLHRLLLALAHTGAWQG